jgi:hypothetical protein
MPAAAYALEKELRAALDAAGRALLAEAFHRREPAACDRAAPKVRYHRDTYRLNKRTPAVATPFGPITLWSWLYLAEQDGAPGLHPLHVGLGIGAGGATPLLAERVARAAVGHTQAEVRAWLRREHGLAWSNERLRAAMRGFRHGLAPFVPALQEARVVQWSAQAEPSRGRHRPVLAVGRDGIMVPRRRSGSPRCGAGCVSGRRWRNRRRQRPWSPGAVKRSVGTNRLHSWARRFSPSGPVVQGAERPDRGSGFSSAGPA